MMSQKARDSLIFDALPTIRTGDATAIRPL
jgi:hypothetical protein